jgi:uncharacterized protein YndB with AHSA1/START domain
VVSAARQQTFIDAPVAVVWDLVSDVSCHPEWWPRVVDVQCEGLEEGCTYREVVKTPLGNDEMNVLVEDLDDYEQLAIRCLNTGTYVRMTFTEAQGGTFVDAEMGMDPQSVGKRAFDMVAGKRYFRRWVAQTMEALGEAARTRTAA